MHWALIVQNYNLEIRHKGSENVLADALSRIYQYSWYVLFFLQTSLFLRVGVLHPYMSLLGVPVGFFFSLSFSPACSLSIPCRSLRLPPLTADWLMKLSLIIK